MKKLIKSSQMARFKAINSIVYGCTKFNELYVYIPHEPDDDIIIRIAKHKWPKNYDFQLNFSGRMIDFRLKKKDGKSQPFPIAFFYLSEKQSVFECIHNYILDFFGNEVEYYWEEGDTRCDKFVLPQLKNVSFCIKMNLNEYCADPEKIESIFSSYPALKAIQMFAGMGKGTFSPESKFYQTESVEIDQSKYNIPDILGHFQGRQAIVKCRRDRENMLVWDLIKFLNRWKSGEAFQNLEYLRIEVSDGGVIPRNQILNMVRAKHIEASRKPPTHTLAKVYNWYNEDPNTDPITSHTYVVRETDNRVASVRIQGNTLCFGVWDKTEEEFLRMID
ncbi:unnamed protein product [Caenorhabditis nigoni]